MWGTVYLFTLGLLGIGWLVDGVRMKWLVKGVNLKSREASIESKYKSVGASYVFTLFPLTGLLGFQHYYLGRIM